MQTLPWQVKGFTAELKALFFGFHDNSDILPFRINPFQLIIATLAINLLSLALPLTAMQVYDRIIARNSVDTLNVLCLGVIIAVLTEAGLKCGRVWLTGWLGAAREHALYYDAMEHVLKKDLIEVEKHGAGYNAEEMASIGKMREFYSGQALITLVDMPFIFLFLGLIAYLGGWLVMAPLALLSLFLLRSWQMGGKMKRVLERRERHDERRYDFIVEMLSGIHTLKSFGAEEAMLRRYEMLEQRSAEANLAVAHTSGDAYNDGIAFAQIMSVAIMLFGAPLAVSGNMSMGTLIACVLLSGRMMQPVQRTLSLWARFQDQRLAREKVQALFSDVTSTKPSVQELPASSVADALSIENLKFNYEKNSNSFLLDGCDLTLNQGDIVAIHGESGSGKSTLLKLICGLYTADEGDIFIDGKEVAQHQANKTTYSIGYLSSESLIFQGTIRDNLTSFGTVNDYQMLEVARLLGIDSEVIKLPYGYETMLDNTPADTIPPGMKQRLTIARVLARKPKLLLFDNADRALDRYGYNQMYRLLTRLSGQVTMVIVSGDNNLIRMANRHFALVDGKIIDAADTLPTTVKVERYRELGL